MSSVRRKLFGTDGVRGLIGIDLTPTFIVRLSLAIGAYFKEGARVLVGMDYRLGSNAIKKIVEGSLTFSGIKVYDAGLTPTPALQYSVKSQGFDGGVVITASHNPPEYNGIKVIGPHGIEIERSDEKVIEEYFWEGKTRLVNWKDLAENAERYPQVNEIYIRAIAEHVDRELIAKQKYRVLVDPVNNVGVLTTPKLLRLLGVKPIVVNATLDTQPSRLPEPTPDSLADIAKITATLGCDLGVGHDGDADRAILIDEVGRIYWGDRSAVLLARHLKMNRGEGGRVYTGVSSSSIVEEVLNPMGVEVVWTKVGSVDIAHTMRRDSGAMCGFEENGGFMYPPHQYVRDGAMKIALFLELMAREGKKASSLFNELPNYYTVKTKYKMPLENALKVIEGVKEEFKAERLITLDGVKVLARDYWILVRPSGTEPVLRVMVEAKTPERANDLLERISKVINEVTKA
ncbi:MAG: phosphoglucosamine mutase [Desulfurococcaceae archaeon]